MGINTRELDQDHAQYRLLPSQTMLFASVHCRYTRLKFETSTTILGLTISEYHGNYMTQQRPVQAIRRGFLNPVRRLNEKMSEYNIHSFNTYADYQ